MIAGNKKGHMKKLLLLLTLLTLSSIAARADIIPTLDSITGSSPNFTWNYTANVTVDQVQTSAAEFNHILRDDGRNGGCSHMGTSKNRPWRWSRKSDSVRPSEPRPQFVRIRWDEVQEPENRVVSREAFLCKMHRKEMALKFPSARGCGQLGEACEYW